MSTIAYYAAFVVVPVLLGLMLLIGLVSLRRAGSDAGNEDLQKKLSFPISAMSFAGGAIASICTIVVLCQGMSSVLAFSTLRQFDQANCSETPLTEKYKLVITQKRNGDEEASIADSKGHVELIWVEQYVVTGNYLMGVTDGDYFWLDQVTGGHRIYDKKEDFLASLSTLGVSQAPVLLPAATVCKTRECKPCATNTRSP